MIIIKVAQFNDEFWSELREKIRTSVKLELREWRIQIKETSRVIISKRQD